MTKEKTQETQFEKRTWAKGDRPGASDFNRIEDGIESAHERVDQLAQVVADNTTAQNQALEVQGELDSTTSGIDFDLLKSLEYLPEGAKVADVVTAFNQLLITLKGEVEGGEVIE